MWGMVEPDLCKSDFILSVSLRHLCLVDARRYGSNRSKTAGHSLVSISLSRSHLINENFHVATFPLLFS
jgi:hypothetical protein